METIHSRREEHAELVVVLHPQSDICPRRVTGPQAARVEELIETFKKRRLIKLVFNKLYIKLLCLQNIDTHQDLNFHS